MAFNRATIFGIRGTFTGWVDSVIQASAVFTPAVVNYNKYVDDRGGSSQVHYPILLGDLSSTAGTPNNFNLTKTQQLYSNGFRWVNLYAKFAFNSTIRTPVGLAISVVGFRVNRDDNSDYYAWVENNGGDYYDEIEGLTESQVNLNEKTPLLDSDSSYNYWATGVRARIVFDGDRYVESTARLLEYTATLSKT